MAKILLVLHNKANRRLLKAWLADRHEIVEAEHLEALPDLELCILDAIKADALEQDIAALKASVAPLFLPVLLIVHREDVGLATRHLWASVDELIITPISRIELQARIQQLLQTRSLSKQLQALGDLQAHDKLQKAFLQTVELITKLSQIRDPYTYGHQHRVAEIAVEIGRAMGLDEQQLLGLRVSGLLHDVGKAAIPSELLSKPGRISAIEKELLKYHTQAGYEVLQNVDFPWPVAQVAYQHHERMDGSGYPRGLKGEEILPEARIMAVADVIEAMSAHRPYRPALGMEQALREIETNRGSKYDATAVDAALKIFRSGEMTLPEPGSA
ncbi:MAG: HD domain-containing protein [Methylophilaceae bacterium]|nr:HD domain-containing protein [Methylophilaceae bacterium]